MPEGKGILVKFSRPKPCRVEASHPYLSLSGDFVTGFLKDFSGIEELKKLGREDIMVVCGGVIPAQAYDYLYQNGAAAIFGPGTVIPDSARKILTLLLEQVEE